MKQLSSDMAPRHYALAIAAAIGLAACAWWQRATPGLEQCADAAVQSVMLNIGPIVNEVLAGGLTSQSTQAALESLGMQVGPTAVVCAVTGAMQAASAPAAGILAARTQLEGMKFVTRHTKVITQ